jgi:hypothetical protein
MAMYSDFNNSLHLKITDITASTLRKDQGTYDPRHNDTDADIVMLIIKTKNVSLTSVNRY